MIYFNLDIGVATKTYFIFHPDYLKYSFGPRHPFWPERAREFLKLLPEEFPQTFFKVVEPDPADDKDVLLVHSGEYLKKVKKMAAEKGALAIDTPLNTDVLQAAYAYTGGSILAACLALDGHLAINLLGGLHHAGISEASGFCVFNDHAIAVRKLQNEGKIKKAFILDLDVHAGQGTQEIFYEDPSVFTVSLHQDPSTLYPGTGFPFQRGEGRGLGYNLNVIFPPGAQEREYLAKLDEVLPLIEGFTPDLLVVVLGVDTFRGDPLASLNLTERSYTKIGEWLRSLDYPKFFCFAGGYSSKVPQLWLNFIKGLVKKPDK
jgi:acetoin utilization protein AcuC